MIASRLHGFGQAPEVLRLDDLPSVDPEEGELVLEMLAAPINPADLNIIEGKYGELPELPAVLGNEGVGRVVGVGTGVVGFEAGDLVLPMVRQTWARRMVVSAEGAIRLPAGIDPFQAAMLAVNPPTAWAMLADYVALRPGEWILQNAANSTVGQCVIQVAKARGWRTLNVVRRPEVVDELLALGADAVVLEGEDFREVVPRICGADRPRLALNAVGGASALNLANGLADGGVVVTYGAMGRQPLKIPNGLLIFRNLEFRGFWLRRLMENPGEVRRIIGLLADQVVAGGLRMTIHRTFGLTEIQSALVEAAVERRSGKVMLDLQR